MIFVWHCCVALSCDSDRRLYMTVVACGLYYILCFSAEGFKSKSGLCFLFVAGSLGL